MSSHSFVVAVVNEVAVVEVAAVAVAVAEAFFFVSAFESSVVFVHLSMVYH